MTFSSFLALVFSTDFFAASDAQSQVDGVMPACADGSCHTSKALFFAGGLIVLGAGIGYAVGPFHFLHASLLILLGVAIGYIVGTVLSGRKQPRVNTLVKLDTDKVVDTVDVEDIGEKKAFCRCWKSSKFPYCDGTHGKHNKECGDNLGPLIVKGKAQ